MPQQSPPGAGRRPRPKAARTPVHVIDCSPAAQTLPRMHVQPGGPV